MTCDYCGARNPNAEERCPRCGRRAMMPRTGELRVDGALATKMQLSPAISAAEASQSRDMSNAVQRKLFYEKNVIPFESFAAPQPTRPARRQKASQTKTPTRSDIPSKPVAKATR